MHHRGIKLIAFILLMVVGYTNANGQKIFTEGVLTYDLNIESAAPDHKAPTTQAVKGTLVIKVKGMQVVKELKVGAGFNNTIIINSANGPVYSLKAIQDKKYAIQLNTEDFKNRILKFENYTLEKVAGEKEIIAGFPVKRAKLNYSDNSSVIVKYTDEWQNENPVLFERFPSFKYIPLAFDINNEDGTILHFILEKITSIPIDNAAFRIPPDYQMITNEEYRQLTK